MRRIPDIIIVMGVVAGALALATGFRIIGVISMLVAVLVGWKRKWCIGALEELLESTGHSTCTDTDDDIGGADGHNG